MSLPVVTPLAVNLSMIATHLSLFLLVHQSSQRTRKVN